MPSKTVKTPAAVRRSRHWTRKLRGLSLVEISLSLAIVGLSTAWVARSIIRDNAQLLARSEAAVLIDMHRGLQTYLQLLSTQIIKTPGESLSLTSGDGLITTSIPNGSAPYETLWPSLEQLAAGGLLPAYLTDTQSRLSPGRRFVTGRITIHPYSGDGAPLTGTETCLRDGCLLRMMVYPEAPDPAAPEFNRDGVLSSPQITSQTMTMLDLKGVVAHRTDGDLYTIDGRLVGKTSHGTSLTGDIGIYAETRIEPVSRSAPSGAYACDAGYFGFGASARGSTNDIEFNSSTPSRCIAPHGSIPVNEQVLAYDPRNPYTGYIRLVCELSEGGNTLSVRAAQDATTPLGPTDSFCTP